MAHSMTMKQAQAAGLGKVQRLRPAVSSRATRLVVRAETGVTKGERVPGALPTYFSSADTIKYLDGSLPGDFGFDPLGLLDPVNQGGLIDASWLKYSEVIHCRWAMLGAAGCIAPEVVGAFDPNFPKETIVPWFASGVIPPAGTYQGYWTDPFSLFFIEVVLVQFAELKRLQDFRNPGSQGKQYFLGLEAALKGSGNPSYPGGPWFNMFNLGGKSEAEMNKLKLSEVKNGRLAMIACFGYGAQATLTREGPWANLLDHLSDPVSHNIIGNFGKVFGEL